MPEINKQALHDYTVYDEKELESDIYFGTGITWVDRLILDSVTARLIVTDEYDVNYFANLRAYNNNL